MKKRLNAFLLSAMSFSLMAAGYEPDVPTLPETPAALVALAEMVSESSETPASVKVEQDDT